MSKVSDMLVRDKKIFFEEVLGTDDYKSPIEDIITKENLSTLVKYFELSPNDEYEETDIVNYELETIGFRISVDEESLNKAKEKINSMDIPHISYYDDESKEYHWGVIMSVEELKTKKGKPYVNVRMDDGSSFRIWHNKLVYLREKLVPSTTCVIKLQADGFGRSLSWDKYSFLGQQDILNID